MAEKFRFDLVSPERVLATLDAETVDLPAYEGDMTAMRDHMALITTLRPGIVRARSGGETREYVVTGGFVEVTAEQAAVLAEQACPRDQASGEMFDRLMKKAEKTVASSKDAQRDVAETRLACLKTLRAELGV